VSAFGIIAALLVFGALIPAIKVEIDNFLEARGVDREKRAFGTGGGRLANVLNIGTTLARKAPFAVIAIALLVSAGGVYGATQVGTSFAQEDFLAEDPPGWMEDLPEPFKPGEYTARSSLDYVNDNFLRQDSQAQILVEGQVTAPDSLERVDRAQQRVVESNVAVVLSNGEADVRSPLTVMRSVAAENETFNATFTAADTDGDRVPDRNLERVYDSLYETAPDQAATVIHRTDDGDYEALRMTVSLQGGASSDAVADQMRDVAAVVDGSGLDATATGQPIVFKLVQDQLLDTVIQSLLITLVAVFAFLMLTYRITDGSATLGFVTLLPVMLSVTWILGTMYLADIPFNVLTGMITSLTVGLGVAYSIHISERYAHELERHRSVWEAMRTTVTGTGGALLGSAATTVGGFGVLVFAILPPLQQFGLITGLTIIYAFLASVLILPSLLVVWTRYMGPDGVFPADDAEPGSGAAAIPSASTGDSSHPEDDAVVHNVEPVFLRPGQTLTGTVTLPRVSGRVLLREHIPVDDVTLTSVDPSPVDAVSNGQTIYVAWEFDEPTTATVEYAATVPPTTGDGTELTFDSAVQTAHGSRPVTGTMTVEVVADIFERILAQGDVSQEDLRAAGEALSAGELSSEQFERIYNEWIRQATTAESRENPIPARIGGDDDD